MSTLQFQQEPASLTNLRRTYREHVTARPDLAGVLDRILEDASDDLAAVGVSFPAVQAAAAPSRVAVAEGLSCEEAWARPDVIDLRFDRRYRWKKAAGIGAIASRGKSTGRGCI